MFGLARQLIGFGPRAVAAAVFVLGCSSCTWPWTKPEPVPTPPTQAPPTSEQPKEDPKPDEPAPDDERIGPPPGGETEEPPKPPEKPPERGGLPTASKVPGRPGFVFSPFNNKIIDVKGIPSGTVVSDPQFPKEAKKHFIVP